MRRLWAPSYDVATSTLRAEDCMDCIRSFP